MRLAGHQHGARRRWELTQRAGRRARRWTCRRRRHDGRTTGPLIICGPLTTRCDHQRKRQNHIQTAKSHGATPSARQKMRSRWRRQRERSPDQVGNDWLSGRCSRSARDILSQEAIRRENSARSYSCAWSADEKHSATYLKVGQPLQLRQAFHERIA
jgi:hypothetical protein